MLPRCAEIASRDDAEVVLVDNGSRDDTPNVLAELLPRHPGCRGLRVETNRGYGFGILTGLRAARGDVLGWTHADMQTDPADAIVGFERFLAPPRDASRSAAIATSRASSETRASRSPALCWWALSGGLLPGSVNEERAKL